MSVSAVIEKTCLLHQEQSLFGWRNEKGEFVWPVTFGQFWKVAKKLAFELLFKIPSNIKLIPVENAVPAVAVASDQNRWEWIAADVACAIAELIVVGIHTNTPVDEVKQIFANTGVIIVVTDKKTKHLFEETKIDNLVYIDMDDIDSYRLAEIDTTGLDEKIVEKRKFLKLNVSPYHTVIYSSGSSGTPKGIGVRKERWIADASISLTVFDKYYKIDSGVVSLASYAPYSHAFDRGTTWQAIVYGARVGYVRIRTESEFYEDLADIQPVLFVALTGIWTRLYATYQRLLLENLKALVNKAASEDTDTDQGLYRLLLSLVLNSDKLADSSCLPSSSSSSSSSDSVYNSSYYVPFTPTTTSSSSSSSSSPSSPSQPAFLLTSSIESDVDVFSIVHKIRRATVAQCAALLKITPTSPGFKVLGTGGSKADPDTLKFLRTLFSGAQIFYGYGCTEIMTVAPGITMMDRMNPTLEIRLDDAPEIGYTNQDLPLPRGEIWVRKKGMTTEYWGCSFNAEAKAISDAAFAKDESGWWFRTGDIGEMDAPNKILRVIDRRSVLAPLYIAGNRFYIPLEARETFYSIAIGRRICLCVDRQEDRIVAVVEMGVADGRITVADAEAATAATGDKAAAGAGVGTRTSPGPSSVPPLGPSPTPRARETVESALLQQIASAAARHGPFKDVPPNMPFELNIPYAVICSADHWSVENGLVTATDKLRRGAIFKRYEEDIRAAYVRRRQELRNAEVIEKK